jgi:mannose-6-phosphate isomerase-like protein (cupin superfamily)
VAFDRVVASISGAERRLPFLGSTALLHATAAETGGLFGIWDLFVPAGGGTEWHLHTREEEVFRVVESRFRFWCAGEVIEGGPGTTVTLPRNVPHKWRNVGRETGRLLALVTPGGFEGMFVDVSHSETDDPAVLAAIEAGYGIVGSGFLKMAPYADWND